MLEQYDGDQPEDQKPLEDAEETTQEAGEDTAAPLDEADEFRDKWMRAMAEIENMRRRNVRDVTETRRREREMMLLNFLGVVDNIERALQADADGDNSIVAGVEAIHQQMLRVLEQYGAKPFDAKEEDFDPKRHDATASIPAPGVADGAIIESIERGYELEDGTILRPAKVVVARNA